MPYKNIEDKRKNYKRWYYRNWPEAKDHIIEKNKEREMKNREQVLKMERKKRKHEDERRRSLGLCTRCGKAIPQDEMEYSNRTLCSTCREYMRIQKMKEKLRKK